MAQSLSNVLLHIVFRTKNRHPWLDVDIEEELFKYIAGTCRNVDCPSHKIGGADDHIHIACSLSRTLAISKLIEEIKTSSSKWIKTKSDKYSVFGWQNGYGAFSIGQSQLPDLKRYIASQREHHRRSSFRTSIGKYWPSTAWNTMSDMCGIDRRDDYPALSGLVANTSFIPRAASSSCDSRGLALGYHIAPFQV